MPWSIAAARRRVASRRTDLLVTPAFAGALALLLLNDLVLKARYGNWLTGKLSDVAGVFTLALFLTAFHPARRTAMHVVTGAFFLWWKSPLSTPALASWNALGLWPMERVIDHTDWIAVAVLPLAWRYAGHAAGARPLLRARPVVALTATLAFAATSRGLDWQPDGTTYVIPMSRARTFQAISAGRSDSSRVVVDGYGPNADSLYVRLADEMYARFELRSAATGETLVTLLETGDRFSDPAHAAVRSCFAATVVQPLRELATTGGVGRAPDMAEHCRGAFGQSPPLGLDGHPPEVVNVARGELRERLAQLNVGNMDLSRRGAAAGTLGLMPGGPSGGSPLPAMTVELRDVGWGATEITLLRGSANVFGDPPNVAAMREALRTQVIVPLRSRSAPRP
jgi:hypothetical protein